MSKILVLALAGPFVVACLAFSSIARGASYTWQAAAGDWSVATNWSGSALPTGSDTAYIIGNDAAAITLPGATCSTLSLGGSGGSGNVQMSGGSLSVGFSELVGDAGMGTFTQTGGTNSAAFFDVGNSLGSYGAYTLSGSGLLSSGFETVGVSGSGTFTQTGGTNPSTFVTIGDNAGSNGVYNLSGTGQFSGWMVHIGTSGTGTLTQTGGSNTITSTLYLGDNTGGSGTYHLGAGQLTVTGDIYLGTSGTGTFIQAGGTSTVTGTLHVGAGAAGLGSYSLGSGQLSAGSENVGAAGPATFTQSAGSNSVSSLSIGSSGTYMLGGGTLQISGNLANLGAFSGNGTPALLTANSSIVDFSSGAWQGLGAIVLNASNSLLIIPPSSNPTAGFAAGSTLGLVHTAGTTLTVPAGQGFAGSGPIHDPISCQGTITASASAGLYLNMPLSISGAGTVNLGSGTMTTNDPASGINGGSLSSVNHYVGSSGTGTFTQINGSNAVSSDLILGNNAGDSGAYSISGSGRLNVGFSETVGNSGMGAFTQTGGTNSASFFNVGNNLGSNGAYSLGGGLLSSGFENVGVSGSGTFTQTGGTNPSSFVTIGGNSGGVGVYNLSGSGQLSSWLQYVGSSGTGTFAQSGGTNTVTGGGTLYLGSNGSGNGTYNLNGGLLLLPGLEPGPGSASFNFSGGTLRASAAFSSSMSLTLGSGGSGAILDTSGNGVTLNAPLVGLGGLTKVGSGTLLLTGSCTYAGPTTIDGGDLDVAGSLTGAATVNANGMLSGTGSLGSVTIAPSGQLAPGDGIGVLHLSGSLTLESGARLDYDLGSSGAGNEVSMPGEILVLGGQQFSDFAFAHASGFGPGTYTLINAGQIEGSLGSGTSGVIGGLPATLAISGQGHDLVLNVVPEPSTLLLLAVGALGVLGWMPRKSKPTPPRSTKSFSTWS